MTEQAEELAGDGSPEKAVVTSEELQQRLERILLGGRRKYTRLEVAEKAGVPEERSRKLWRALGFANVDDDEVVFTESDVQAVRISDQLVQAGLVDQSVEFSVTRALGQHLSRLAEWQVDMLWTLINSNPELGRSERQIGRLVEQVLPEMEQVQNFVWRRHLAAYTGRALAAPEEDAEGRTEVVGFVDMVGYTRMTRRIGEDQLGDVLDRFESLVTDVIGEHHGRVVKMIGDEVLFVTDTAASGAEIALALTERTEADEDLPAVRGGLALGRVLSRFGDVYGSVVNLASRLTSVARPGTILVDRALAEELAGEPAYELRSRRPISVRGYNRLRPSALRRARPDQAEGRRATEPPGDLPDERAGTGGTEDTEPEWDETDEAGHGATGTPRRSGRPRGRRRRR